MMNAAANATTPRHDPVPFALNAPKAAAVPASRVTRPLALPKGPASVQTLHRTPGDVLADSAMDGPRSSRESRIGFIAIVFGKVCAAIRTFSATRKARAEARAQRIAGTEMGSLSDHVLRDIGLARGRTSTAPQNAYRHEPRV